MVKSRTDSNFYFLFKSVKECLLDQFSFSTNLEVFYRRREARIGLRGDPVREEGGRQTAEEVTTHADRDKVRLVVVEEKDKLHQGHWVLLQPGGHL